MQVMHNINKHREDSHVKTNDVHTLFRVQKYGLMPFEQFKEILSASDLKRCKKTKHSTWYTIPMNVFTSFTYQHEIGRAADEGLRAFMEQANGEVTEADKASAMKWLLRRRLTS